MMEMVERVAKAMYDWAGEQPYTGIPMPEMADFVSYAREAIAAMREPTDAMCRARVPNTYDEIGDPMDERGALDNTCAAWVWKAMIDAALTTTNPTTTNPKPVAPGFIDDATEIALSAYDNVYTAEYMASGATDNKTIAMRAAVEAVIFMCAMDAGA